jgi:Zn-finger nucleic acid-binding protein
MRDLERQGITTAAIRNRSRRRQARLNQHGLSGSADIPNLLACCGVGLAFGEATEEGFQATREHQKEEYVERKKQKEAREEELRRQFQKIAAKKKAAARRDDVEEVFEVVED